MVASQTLRGIQMNVILIVITAFTVSIDSFIAGFSLSINKRKKISLPIIVAVVTYALCLVASLTGALLKDFLQSYVQVIGAGILIILGISNLFRQESTTLKVVTLSESFAIGFGVGMDGAAAALSLTIQGVGDVIFTPLLFAAMHFATVFAGQSLAQASKLNKANVVSSVMFFILAALKIID